MIVYGPDDFVRDSLNPWTGYVRVFGKTAHPTPREVIIAQTVAGLVYFGLAIAHVNIWVAAVGGAAALYLVAATAEAARDSGSSGWIENDTES